MKDWIYGFFMAWGMFLAIPCPLKLWNEKARSKMICCLPLVGLVVGGVWLLAAYVGRFLPQSAAGLLIAAAPWLTTGFLPSGRLHGRVRRGAEPPRPAPAAGDIEGLPLRRLRRDLHGAAGAEPVELRHGAGGAAFAAPAGDPGGQSCLARRWRC